jgi:sigma-E factor negative regulatory protein RseC
MNKVADGRRGYIRVLPGDQSTNNCQVDDQVLISIPEELILRGSLIAYMLPLVSMLGGAIAGVTAFPAHQDVAAALGCVAGMVLGFCLVRWHSNLHSDDPGFQPTLVKVLRTDAVHVL